MSHQDSEHTFCKTENRASVECTEFLHRRVTPSIQKKLQKLYPPSQRIESGVDIDPQHTALNVRASNFDNLYRLGLLVHFNLKKHGLEHSVSLGLQ